MHLSGRRGVGMVMRFTFEREAYFIAVLQYGVPLFGWVVFGVLWLLGYLRLSE